MKVISKGQSLNDLLKEYGTGEHGFYNDWFQNEPFANDKPEEGTYEINIEKKELENLTFDEQTRKLKKGWDVPHPALLALALLEHRKETGEYLMKDWWSRTSSVDSDGSRVFVGNFHSDGLYVDSDWDGHRYGRVGLSSARKFTKKLAHGTLEPVDASNLERRVKSLEEKMAKLEKIINI